METGFVQMLAVGATVEAGTHYADSPTITVDTTRNWRYADSPCITVDTRDSDDDGMPDGWEIDNGLSPYSGVGKDGPDGDLDGDGQSNWNELLAGTAANDPGSALQIKAVTRNESGEFVVTWQSVSGRTYKVLYADSPSEPWQGDLPDSQITAGTGQTSLSYTDRTAGTASKRFYRIALITP